MPDHDPMYPANRQKEDRDVRLVVGCMRGAAIVDGARRRRLWIAVALDQDGGPAALGLYDSAPSIGDLTALVGDEPAADLALGPQWTFPEAASIGVDLALLWQTSELRSWFADRGMALHALAPLGPDRIRTNAAFEILAKSLAAAMARTAWDRDEDGCALVTPRAAAGAAREWRAARDVTEAGQ